VADGPGSRATRASAQPPGSGAVTTFRVSPQGGAALVQISSTWESQGGISGLLERMFGPRVMRAIYADELRRLDAYAREHRPA